MKSSKDKSTQKSTTQTGNLFNLSDRQVLLGLLAAVLSVFSVFTHLYAPSFLIPAPVKQEIRQRPFAEKEVTPVKELLTVEQDAPQPVVAKQSRKQSTSQSVSKPQTPEKKAVKKRKSRVKIISKPIYPLRKNPDFIEIGEEYSSVNEELLKIKVSTPKLESAGKLKATEFLPTENMALLSAQSIEPNDDLLQLTIPVAPQAVDLDLLMPDAEIVDYANVADLEREEEEVTISEILPANTSAYSSKDFVWNVNNYGIKSHPRYSRTADGRAVFSQLSTGLLLKVNDLEGIDAKYGVFVERSEDGKEYESIGVLNTEQKEEIYFLDPEPQRTERRHYRLRAVGESNKESIFGSISVFTDHSIFPLDLTFETANKAVFALETLISQPLKYFVKEARTGKSVNGFKQLEAGLNKVELPMNGEEGLYYAVVETGGQTQELLLEKESADEEFYYSVGGQQALHSMSFDPAIVPEVSFDFFLKNGNSLIFDKIRYQSEPVYVKKAFMEELQDDFTGRCTDKGSMWISAAQNIDYAHREIPVLLESKGEEIAAKFNIYAAKDIARPLSLFNPTAAAWRIPGLASCPKAQLLVFDKYGNNIYAQENVNAENMFNGTLDGENLPEGIYFYVLGSRGGWFKIER